ncbi:MAG TPA: hypothetical protein VH815_10335 [Acidobacteriota bacterium]|jgi:hypothetical protein
MKYNDLGEIFQALTKGETTIDEVKEMLANVTMYVRSGKSFRALKFENLGVVNGGAANIYVLDDKIDRAGNPVEKRSRSTNGTAKKSRAK